MKLINISSKIVKSYFKVVFPSKDLMKIITIKGNEKMEKNINKNKRMCGKYLKHFELKKEKRTFHDIVNVGCFIFYILRGLRSKWMTNESFLFFL